MPETLSSDLSQEPKREEEETLGWFNYHKQRCLDAIETIERNRVIMASDHGDKVVASREIDTAQDTLGFSGDRIIRFQAKYPLIVSPHEIAFLNDFKKKELREI